MNFNQHKMKYTLFEYGFQARIATTNKKISLK